MANGIADALLFGEGAAMCCEHGERNFAFKQALGLGHILW